MDAWPATLPQEMLLRHNENAMRGAVPFQPMSGPQLLWQVGDYGNRPCAGTMFLETAAQRATFLMFFRETLGMGTRQFTWQSDTWDGSEFVCQFADSEPYQLTGGNGEDWRLSLNLVLVREIGP